MFRFKLDENFSPSMANRLQSVGYDAETVLGESLSGEPDELIFEHSQKEMRCLVTIDLDFSNILRFQPKDTPGIIVIRPNRPITLEVMDAMITRLISLLGKYDPTGCLWIVEPTQLRIRKGQD
jgi:predicted nuclease of predicted toxin-antitoxin system